MVAPAALAEADAASPARGDARAFVEAMETFGGAMIDLSDDPAVLALCDAAVADMAPLAAKGANRVQDLWRRSSAVRALATLPQVIGPLEALHGRRAIPFQTLNFTFGSQQAAHSDLIHFTPDPIEAMCGVWIALEDVHADAGPLEYFPGSHRWPVLTREGLGAADDEAPDAFYAQRYEPAMAAQIASRGAVGRPAMLRKGQVFVWAANLVHGGMPRRDPARTRRSQVTHVFFQGCGYHTLLTQRAGRRALRLPQDIRTGRFAWPVVRPGERVAAKTFLSACADRLTRRTPSWRA
jgi:ectoine hydroxylase-related dioxygenase (phytanoyl-CoA dioxygenase family)